MAGTAPRIDKIESRVAASSGTTIDASKISAPFTTVVNRAQMLDLANDCGSRFRSQSIITSVQRGRTRFLWFM